MKKVITRIILDILLVISVITLPFWFTAIFALVLLFVFKHYFEFMFVFLLSDSLYGVGLSRYYGIVYLSFIISVIIFAASYFIKKEMHAYSARI